MSLVRNSLETIINLVDYTNNQCSPTASLGAALDINYLLDARESLQTEPSESRERTALLVLLDQIDFNEGACTPFEMVAAVLPKEVIRKVREVLA